MQPPVFESKSLKIKSIILFSSSVILLHLFRNVSDFYYVILGIWMLLAGGVLLLRLERNIGKILLTLFFLFYVALISSVAGVAENPAIGIFRLFYLAPFVFFVFSMNFSDHQIRVFWKIIAFFTIISSVSLLFQFYSGPISWFADSSERAGVERFSSLAGSLTVFGSIVGVGILASTFFVNSFTIFFISIVLLTVGAILSLQKMGVANYFIAMSLLLLTGKIRSKRKIELVVVLFFMLVLGIFFIMSSGNFEAYTSYIAAIFSKDASDVYDVSIWQSIIDRFSELPLVVVDYWGWKLLIGVGVYGGAGGLGYQEYPMAHNLLLEIIAIFGIPLGCVVIYFLCKYTIYAFRVVAENRNPSTTLSGLIYILLTFSSLFTGALFYHPVIGLIFWFAASNIYKEFNNVQK